MTLKRRLAKTRLAPFRPVRSGVPRQLESPYRDQSTHAQAEHGAKGPCEPIWPPWTWRRKLHEALVWAMAMLLLVWLLIAVWVVAVSAAVVGGGTWWLWTRRVKAWQARNR